MDSLEIGSTVRIREDQCIGQAELVARGIIVEIVEVPNLGTGYKVWWDDGFPSDCFFADELELAEDTELSLPQFADA